MEEQVQEEIQEEVEAPQPKEIPTEIVQEALDTGWIPEDQFKGDKSKWRPADEWVDRGRNLIPIIRSQVKDYKSTIDTLKNRLEAQEKTTEKILKMSEKIGEQSYKKALNELKKQQMAAVADGNTEEWARLEEQKEQLEKPEKIEFEQTPQTTPTFDSWRDKNEWYGSDDNMTIFADGFGRNLKETNPNLTYEQILETTATKVREMFPQRFENPARSLPPSVDSSSISSGEAKSTGEKTYADLPTDAKKQCNVWINDGTIKSKEQYVKAYFEE